MILSKLQSSPQKTVPLAMALLTTGLMLLTFGIAWPRLSYPAAHLGHEWNDFLRGFLFGISIVLETWAEVILVVAGRTRES